MPSGALTSLEAALAEVDDLEKLFPGIRGSIASARAVGRAGVVLLSSHFERYFYAVNEEAVTFLNGTGMTRATVPMNLRLLHSRYAIDALALTQWPNRAVQLEDFVRSDRWLWQDGEHGHTNHDRLLQWMSSPDPENLVRYYRNWGVEDIFSVVTRTPQSRRRMWLGIRGLVDKRNSIAHGDFASEASRGDVRRYRDTVLIFCTRADRVFRTTLRRMSGADPWSV